MTKVNRHIGARLFCPSIELFAMSSCLQRRTWIALNCFVLLLAAACETPPSNTELIGRFSENRDSFERLLELCAGTDSTVATIEPGSEKDDLMKRLNVRDVQRDRDAVYLFVRIGTTFIRKGYVFVDAESHPYFPAYGKLVDPIDDSKLEYMMPTYQPMNDGWYLYCEKVESD